MLCSFVFDRNCPSCYTCPQEKQEPLGKGILEQYSCSTSANDQAAVKDPSRPVNPLQPSSMEQPLAGKDRLTEIMEGIKSVSGIREG